MITISYIHMICTLHMYVYYILSLLNPWSSNSYPPEIQCLMFWQGFVVVSGLSRNLGIKMTEIKKYHWWTKPCTGCADLNIKTRYFVGHFTIYRCRIYTSNSTINLELPLVESSNTQRQKHDCFITQLELGTATHWIETIRSQDAWRFLPSPYYGPRFWGSGVWR